jgi:hypothetical protein
MRLDIDVLRDTLLYIEDGLSLEVEQEDGVVRVRNGDGLDPKEVAKVIAEKKQHYTQEAVFYALRMCSDAGYINECVKVGSSGTWSFAWISDISFLGHEFIECVRSNTTWSKTKEAAKKAGCYALSFLGQLATQTALGYVGAKLDF